MDENQRNQLREYLHAAKALLTSMDTNLSVDRNHMFPHASYKTYIMNYNALLAEVGRIVTLPNFLFGYDLKKIPSAGDTVSFQQKELYDGVHANLSVLKSLIESKLDLKADEITNLANFIQINLRRVVFEPPDRELTIQNSIEALLIGRNYQKGVDYDREVGRVKISVKELIPDFIFARLGLALEAKLSKDKAKSKEIVDEINADIMAYGTKYPFILFVVYDLGSIRDVDEFKRDLEKKDGVLVIIVKH